MASENLSRDTGLTYEERSRTFWSWILASGIGASVSSGLFVLILFTVFDGWRASWPYWQVGGLCFILGTVYGMPQWWVLRHVARYRKEANTSLLALWPLVTGVGVAGIALWATWSCDLKELDGRVFNLCGLPGPFFLGFVQWAVLYKVFRAGVFLIFITGIYICILFFLGFALAFVILFLTESAIYIFVPFFISGLASAPLQAVFLVSDLDADLRRA